MKTQAEVRKDFWTNAGFDRSKELDIKYSGIHSTDFRADVRCAFVDYVDSLQKSGEISEKLASRVTLA